jgi:MFS family permease
MSDMSLPTALSDVRRIAQGPMRKLFVGQFLNALGNGLTLSLIVVYLHSVRDIPVGTATALLAWQAVLALAASPLSGTLVDRFSPRPVLLGAVLLTAAGLALFANVDTVHEAFLAMSVISLGGAGIWGPSSALVARLVASPDRSTAFGFGFMLLNLGLGMGGLIGSTIINIDDPSTFTLLYRLTALTYVVLFGAVLAMGDVGRIPDEPAAQDGGAGTARDTGSWREVLRDRTLLRFAAAGLLMLTFGYGSVEAGVSLYITKYVGLDERFIGIIFAANTGVIVLAQLFVLSMIKGRSRSRLLGGVGLLWGVSWLLFGTVLGLPQWGAVAILIAAISVFAIGETLWSPTAPALLNDLAPEHLRGRYNSAMSVLWGLSGALGPLLTGLFLSADHARAWTLTLAVGCLAAATISVGLRAHLTPDQDGTGTDPTPHDPEDPREPDLGPSLRPAAP